MLVFKLLLLYVYGYDVRCRFHENHYSLTSSKQEVKNTLIDILSKENNFKHVSLIKIIKSNIIEQFVIELNF